MAAAAGRGAQSMNFMYFKPMLRKAYHRKTTSPDTVKLNGEEVKNTTTATTNQDRSWWLPDERTGIFYPKGQEKVMEDVPQEACKNFGRINWFSSQDDF